MYQDYIIITERASFCAASETRPNERLIVIYCTRVLARRGGVVAEMIYTDGAAAGARRKRSCRRPVRQLRRVRTREI